MGEDSSGPSLQTVDRTVRIVEALRANDGGGVTELAEQLDLSPTTVYNHLSTLEQNRFVVKDGDRYRLGLRFLTVGGDIRNRFDVLPFAEVKVAEIADRTGERTQFLAEEHGLAVTVCTEMGPDAVPAETFVGKTSYLHASAAGKSILSAMPAPRVAEILDRWGLSAQTDSTITDRDDLLAELDEISQREYAFNDEESIEGLRAVGAPVVANGTVQGALSVSGPTHRMKGPFYREELPDILLGAANELELKVSHV